MGKRNEKTIRGWLPPLLVPAFLAIALASLLPAGAAKAAPAAPAATAKPPVVRQLITVTVPGYSPEYTYATLRVYELSGKKWVSVYGPWTARVGYNGVAPPGKKREGDGRTPSGTYGFRFFFGVDSPRNMGFAFPFRVAHTYDYWDDDPTSPQYNEWINSRTQNPGANPEPMHNVPAYNYAAVIAYNTARTPYLGSAIFLHVGTNSATAGCVSLPQAELIKVLRWLRPADNPRIEITAS